MRPIDAFRANAATFYDLSTDRKHSLVPRYAFIFALSALFEIVGLGFAGASLSALTSVLGLLLGFGFSVQFYIAGTSIPAIKDKEYFEDIGDKRLVARLEEELYNNIVYLNYVSLMALIVSIFLLIDTPDTISRWLMQHANFLDTIGGFILWVLAFEVVTSFYRILMRASFFFGEVRRLSAQDSK